jgi:hypothetical protein
MPKICDLLALSAYWGGENCFEKEGAAVFSPRRKPFALVIMLIIKSQHIGSSNDGSTIIINMCPIEFKRV